MSNKSLLCIPYGGLNDVLCQIYKCLNYSIKYKRTLFIDTRFSGILVEFPQLFKIKSLFDISIIDSVTEQDYLYLNTLKTKPVQARGRLALRPHWPKNSLNYCVYGSNTLFTFDFNISHDEELLVHSQCGGGVGSHKLLHHLIFSDDCQRPIKSSLLSMPKDYISIHTRNTDLKTDFIKFFEDIYDQTINKNLFIASDSEDVINYSKNYFKKSVVFCNNNMEYFMGNRLHSHDNYFSDNEKFQQSLMSLIDLTLLASSNKFFYTSSSNNVISGYSMLACYLNKNKKLINSLLE